MFGYLRRLFAKDNSESSYENLKPLKAERDKYGRLVLTRKRLDDHCAELKRRIYEYASKNPNFSGTVVGWNKQLKYDNDDLMSHMLGELWSEDKLEMRGRETVFRDDGAAIGLYYLGLKMS